MYGEIIYVAKSN